MARKGKGGQKVNMFKMAGHSNLQALFSKRCSNLFNKANELSILCDAQVALIVFSPTQNVHSFGHPSVETVVDNFLTKKPLPNDGTHQFIESHQNKNDCDLNVYLAKLENQIDAETKRGEILDQIRKARQSKRWWERPIDELDLQQLERLKVAMEIQREKIKKISHERMLETIAPPRSLGDPTSSFGFNGQAPFLARETRFSAKGPFYDRESWFNGHFTLDAQAIRPSGGVPFDARDIKSTSP